MTRTRAEAAMDRIRADHAAGRITADERSALARPAPAPRPAPLTLAERLGPYRTILELG